MRAQSMVLLILLLAAGCLDVAPPPPVVTPSRPNVNRADQYISSWTSMGMWMPDGQQIQFFRSDFAQSKDKLQGALAAKDADVRQRAAYVIQKIGKDARTCGPELLERLKVEPVRLVRIYIIDALAAVRYDVPDAITELARRFESLSDENIPRSPVDYEYADVDEKINIAAALYVLNKDANKERYLQFVTQWLKAPASNLSHEELRGYGERRWVAVISLEGMPGATSAVPLLEAMLEEKSAEPWVAIHVPRVLKALRQGDGP
ncbi:MAG: repeat-containing protein [Planctomycetaceae bacterium]|nr:repeat-containing protein [Planctomycetaceae bacterium]